MIAEPRKKNLNKLAIYLAENFSEKNKTQLQKLADAEDLPCHLDHYEDAFDGMLCYDDTGFHVHINIDRGNEFTTKRGRFTIAHELAHFFIDEHRIGLKNGTLPPHGSRHDIDHKDLIEQEADYFASCLLMPDNLFRKFSGGPGKKFSLQTILNLSDEFQSSVLSTALKFVEIGTHSVCIVVSENNRVKWSARSYDFPKWASRFKVGQALPPTTVAGEYFTKTDAKFTGVEAVQPNDWFFAHWDADRDMYEQCYYSESYGYVISVLLFD